MLKSRINFRTWITLVLLLPALSSVAQYAGFTPVTDQAAFSREFALQSAKIQSISSIFRQEKVLSALTEKIVSTGVFKFKRADKVRMEYQKPFSYLMIMNGDAMLIKDEQKENRMSVRSNKLLQQINRIMIDCVQGSILNSRDFTAKVWENDKQYLLELKPVGRGLKDFFQNIVLTVEKKDYSVQSLQMNEPSGDYTIITFTEKKINGEIPDTSFAL
jgi:outer membrane lipoprotein-sorting protein